VSAWLNVKDPVSETHQTCGNFWKRVGEYYNANKIIAFDPFERSLMYSWLTILEEVNKFYGWESKWTYYSEQSY